MADNNVFYNLSYSHKEIEDLLRKIASGNVLYVDDYEKLVNVIGIDNISTFSGNYEDLQNLPNIPHYTSDLTNDMNFTTVDAVNMKMEALRDHVISMLNEYENDNESTYITQAYINNALDNFDTAIRKYAYDLVMQHTAGVAMKSDVLKKSDVNHQHEISDVGRLQFELDKKADLYHEHDYDLLFASKASEHTHDNDDVLDNLSQEQINYWNNGVQENTIDIEIIKNELEDLDRDSLIELWKILHSGYERDEEGHLIETGLGHTNLEVLNGITDDRVNVWDNCLEFKTEKLVTKGVGGIEEDDNLNGLDIHEILQRMLFPDQKPDLTLVLSNNPAGYVFEIGSKTTINKIIAKVIRNSNKISTITLYENGEVKEALSLNVADGGNFDFILNEDIKESKPEGYFKVIVKDAKDYSVSANIPAINFYYPCYYGVVAENITASKITESQLKGLSKHIGAKGNKSFVYNANNQRMVFAYPSSYGDLTSILDLNGFEQIRAFEKAIINIKTVDGKTVQYYVYINNANTNTNFKMTYKF